MKINIVGIFLMFLLLDECYLNVVDVLDSYYFNGNRVVVVLIMWCVVNYIIYFNLDVRLIILNVVFYV